MATTALSILKSASAGCRARRWLKELKLMAKTESTGKKTASTAGKVLHSKTASKDEKSVAASALAQTKTKDVTSKAVASKAGKILHDPKASKEAKLAAASALTQAAPKKAAAKKK
jgi:hypothetical protein